MPRLLELFSGTGSVGRAFATLGWGVVSIDLDPREHHLLLRRGAVGLHVRWQRGCDLGQSAVHTLLKGAFQRW